MDWDAIGAIGEVVGGLGVIFTLGYLAIQIRQNTRSLKSAAYQSAIASMSEITGSTYENEDTARVMLHGCRGEDLTDVEEFRFGQLLTRLFRNFENFYYQHESGAMEDHLWYGMRNSMVGFYHMPAVRAWWKIRRKSYSIDFAKFLESQSEESASTVLSTKIDMEAALDT